MNSKKRRAMAEMIEARLAALARENGRGQQGTEVVTLDQQSVGRLSRMDALQSQAMSVAAQARRAAQKTQLEQALGRLDDPDYGYCVECGEEIAQKRLEFNPAVLLCIACAKG